MSRGDSIINRVNGALKRISGMSRPAYLRVVTETGGDQLLGRPGTVINSDSIFYPQPVYHQLGHYKAMVMSTANLTLVADDYVFTFSPTIITKNELQQGNVFILLKNGVQPPGWGLSGFGVTDYGADDGEEEILEIIYYNDIAIYGETVAFSIIARSIAR